MGEEEDLDVPEFVGDRVDLGDEPLHHADLVRLGSIWRVAEHLGQKYPLGNRPPTRVGLGRGGIGAGRGCVNPAPSPGHRPRRSRRRKQRVHHLKSLATDHQSTLLYSSSQSAIGPQRSLLKRPCQAPVGTHCPSCLGLPPTRQTVETVRNSYAVIASNVRICKLSLSRALQWLT